MTRCIASSGSWRIRLAAHSSHLSIPDPSSSGTTSGSSLISASTDNARRFLLSWSIQEFNNLVAKYHAYCVAPVFDRITNDARAVMTDTDRSKLNGFDYRYGGFVNDYTQFLRELAESHTALKDLPRYLPIPNPL
jgi:hypothetical protein